MIREFDVVILGAGLAGLSLARQLTLTTGKRILLLEKRKSIPPNRQKVGEATVQVGGYYFSKVLDLEDHLLQEHLMKYNLRFYWPTRQPGDSYEDYSQSYIRTLSNIASYQLDRNKIEAELLKRNQQASTFAFLAGVSDLTVELSEIDQHSLTFAAQGERHEIRTRWVVDATGRSRFMTRKLQLAKANPIRHGASFFWVEGLVNIEKLTDFSSRASRLNDNRRMIGHFPVWLATNHLAGEGYWVWLIPLRGKTSIGLVYERNKVSPDLVSTPEKTRNWLCQRFPLLARDLKSRKILDQGMFRDFSYDCAQTINDSHWALTGEAGRFSDPLYSPGSDLIALHNTLIADCILTDDPHELATKTRLYEVLMRAWYQAYLPSYAVSYEVLGDQECFTMKYAWELAVYFTFFVFPFINDLFTDLRFIPTYLRQLAKMGELNHALQNYITDYYRWKKVTCRPPSEPRFFDFMEFGALQSAEKLFYQVGLAPMEAASVLAGESLKLSDFARHLVTYICASVSGKRDLLDHPRFSASLELEHIVFDPASICQRAAGFTGEIHRGAVGFDAERLLQLRGTFQAESLRACAAD